MSDAGRFPAPGIHLGVPFADYRALPAVSHSGVIERIRRSPLYLQKMLGKERDATKATTTGRAVNDLVLTPDLFDARFVVTTRCVAVLQKGGQCSKNGSVVIGGRSYCRTHAEEGAETDPREALSEAEAKRALDMAQAVLDDEHAGPLLARCAKREVSVVWIDRATGLLCKGRVDFLDDGPFACAGDLKKSRGAHPDRFPYEIVRYGYHRQGAWYREGLRAHGIQVEDWTIVAVNDQAGDDVHEVGVYPLIADAIQLGREENRAAVRLYAQCLKENRWQGFGLVPMSVPAGAVIDGDGDGDGEDEEEAA